MKTTLSMELKKLFRSQTLIWAIVIGAAISLINVVENYGTAQWFYDIQSSIYSPGYETLSILHNWINGAQETVGETIFFMVYPLLAAIPFAWSLHSERYRGYTNQIFIRRSKKTYLTAKYIVVFLSGGITIVSAMVFNLLVNMWILPVCNTMHALVGYGDTVFLSKILFSKPWLYLLLSLITSFFWAGTLACLGLTASLFLRNSMAAVLFPFALFLGGSFILEGLASPYSVVTFMGRYETSPMQLLHAMTLNSNPAWYVWTILLGLLVLITIIYFWRGMRDEML